MPNAIESESDFVARKLRRQSQLEAQRYVFNSLYQEIAERILPRQAIFFRRGPIPMGEKRTQKIFDSTAQLALPRFAAAIESLVTPRTGEWHQIRPSDPTLADDRDVKVYCDQVKDILFAARYSARANFPEQTHEGYIGLGAFGVVSLFIDDNLSSLRYRAEPLSSLWFAENHVGIIDTVHRRFPFTARQAAQRWGADSLPPNMSAVLQNNPDIEFDFLHIVEPRETPDSSRSDFRGMPYASFYIAENGRKLMEEGGYRTFPWAIGRYLTAPREVYGRSVAMDALADIKMNQEQMKTVLRAAHKVVDPPMLLQEDGALQAFDMRPGALNFGGVDDKGNQVAHPLVTNARIDIGMDMIQATRKSINDAFLMTLFQILVENRTMMTATEVMERAQEKGALLAPAGGRLQSEFLGRVIEREIDLLAHAGQFPPMPRKLQMRGGAISIEYTSPLNRFQKAASAAGIMRTIESIAPLIQVDPSVMDIFDMEEMVRELADANGMSPKTMRSPEAVAAVKQQRANDIERQQLINALPAGAGAVKDLSQAAATAQNIPPPQQGAQP